MTICIAASLEEVMHMEHSRGQAMEKEWSSVRDTVNVLIVNGDLDIIKLRRDLLAMK